jgi:hypothetical protein
MDWITGLPTTAEGYDSILVFVCALSDMVHLQAARTYQSSYCSTSLEQCGAFIWVTKGDNIGPGCAFNIEVLEGIQRNFGHQQDRAHS